MVDVIPLTCPPKALLKYRLEAGERKEPGRSRHVTDDVTKPERLSDCSRVPQSDGVTAKTAIWRVWLPLPARPTQAPPAPAALGLGEFHLIASLCLLCSSLKE